MSLINNTKYFIPNEELTYKYKVVATNNYTNVRVLKLFVNSIQTTTLDVTGASLWVDNDIVYFSGSTFYCEFSDNNTQMVDGSGDPITFDAQTLYSDIDNILNS